MSTMIEQRALWTALFYFSKAALLRAKINHFDLAFAGRSATGQRFSFAASPIYRAHAHFGSATRALSSPPIISTHSSFSFFSQQCAAVALSLQRCHRGLCLSTCSLTRKRPDRCHGGHLRCRCRYYRWERLCQCLWQFLGHIVAAEVGMTEVALLLPPLRAGAAHAGRYW